MTYTLRVWVNGELEETATAETAEPLLKRFDEVVASWPGRWEDFSATVNAEPGPFPARSWTIASRQQHRRPA